MKSSYRAIPSPFCATADDAAGRCGAQAERGTQGQDELTDLERIGISESRRGQRFRMLDLDHGEVGAAIDAVDLTFEIQPVFERHRQRPNTAHDVGVGDNESGLVDDDPRAAAALLGDGHHRHRGADQLQHAGHGLLGSHAPETDAHRAAEGQDVAVQRAGRK